VREKKPKDLGKRTTKKIRRERDQHLFYSSTVMRGLKADVEKDGSTHRNVLEEEGRRGRTGQV
jgi:hypothetical protein